MDALAQDAAEARPAIDHQHANATPSGRLSCRHAGSPRADDRDVVSRLRRSKHGRGGTLRPRHLDIVGARRSDHPRSTQALVDLLGSAPQLAADDAQDLGRAEAAVALAHHRAATPLERVERQHRQRTAQRRDNLALGDLAAAADDVSPGGILGDGAFDAVLAHHRQERPGAADRIERGVLPRRQRLGDPAREILGDGGRGGEAGRVDAGGVEEARRVLRLAHDEVARGARGAQSREVGDHPAGRAVRPRAPRAIDDELEPLARGAQALLGLLRDGVRTDEEVAVDRRRHEHALARGPRHLEDRMVEQRPQGGFVEDVVAAHGRDLELAPAHEVVDLVGVDACGVDDRVGLDDEPGGGADAPAGRGGAIDRHDALVEQELRPVGGGVLGSAVRDAVRIADRPRLGDERAAHL